MRSSKPILTAPDSGGVLEFVEDGRNGFVCANPTTFAEKIDLLFNNHELAAKLGATALETSRLIPTWAEVAETLLTDFYTI